MYMYVYMYVIHIHVHIQVHDQSYIKHMKSFSKASYNKNILTKKGQPHKPVHANISCVCIHTCIGMSARMSIFLRRIRSELSVCCTKHTDFCNI